MMERLLKKTDEAVAGRKYSEALTWLKQARVLAPADRQKQIDDRTLEVRKMADAGSLFAVQPQPIPAAQPQPIPQPARPASSPAPVHGGQQPASAPQPQDGQMRMFPRQQPVQPEYGQPAQYAAPQPAYPPQMQGAQPYFPPVQAQHATGREYHTPPQDTPEAYSFDKDDESDRELLRNDPYAEYIDFPEEYRVRDEAQMELVCC